MAIGDTVYNFELVRIYENRIVFQENKKTYQLFLGRAGPVKLVKKDVLMPNRENVKETKPDVPETNKNSVIKKEFNRSYVVKKILDEWKMIMEQMVVFPNIIDGRTKGFKITKIPTGSFLSEMGINNNDIILKLDNEELADISDLLTLINKYQKKNRVEMTLERSGEFIQYLYFLK
ncbi:hypothetical protein ACFLRW_04420 [Acidobacteriota bacterium]